MSEEPISHIARGRLPWRSPDDDVTECGKNARDFKSVISIDAARALWKKHGKTRASFLLCVTCVETAGRYAVDGGGLTWEAEPVGLLGRYVASAGRFYSGRYGDGGRLANELRAVAALVAAHREEFDAYLAGLGTTVDLSDARSAKRRREIIR